MNLVRLCVVLVPVTACTPHDCPDPVPLGPSIDGPSGMLVVGDPYGGPGEYAYTLGTPSAGGGGCLVFPSGSAVADADPTIPTLVSIDCSQFAVAASSMELPDLRDLAPGPHQVMTSLQLRVNDATRPTCAFSLAGVPTTITVEAATGTRAAFPVNVTDDFARTVTVTYDLPTGEHAGQLVLSGDGPCAVTLQHHAVTLAFSQTATSYRRAEAVCF